MRPARLSVVLVAHGSRDPRGAAATSALARAVRRSRPAWDVHVAYLDHAGPRPLDVLASLPGRRAVVVPLLLTKAYHGRVDIPAVLAAASDLPITVTLADVLGPAASFPAPEVPSLLLDGLVRRLRACGPSGAVSALDAVVLAAAGTRDPAARATVEWAADALSARLSLPCAVAYASAAPPLPGAAVDLLRASGARRIGVASYFLAPGYLYDLAARSALEAGAVAVAEPLSDAPELARLVAVRVDESLLSVSAAA
ncbi:sirohydrochlorin chelatase [Actinoplanes sp. NPDC051513]|uniref:sirohydrochlorin chelatase n=1 Tax=Actinoplanes sp. NPDC051513 TaxID=3363908 RepID=UPI0037946928